MSRCIMLDRFDELLQAVGDRKIANDILADCTDAELREKLINYIQEKDDLVCSILGTVPTKITEVDTSTVVFKYDDDKLSKDLNNVERSL